MGKQRCNWTSADKWYFISCNFVHRIIICRQEFMHLYKSKTFITVSVLELKMERKCSLRSTSPWISWQLEVRMKYSLVRDHSCFQWLYFMTIICRNCNNKLAIYIYWPGSYFISNGWRNAAFYQSAPIQAGEPYLDNSWKIWLIQTHSSTKSLNFIYCLKTIVGFFWFV